MSKVIKQLFKEEMEEVERKEPHLFLVPPPAPPPHFSLHWQKKTKPKDRLRKKYRVYFLFSIFLLVSALYFKLNRVVSPKVIENKIVSKIKAAGKNTSLPKIEPVKVQDDLELNRDAIQLYRKQKYLEAAKIFNEILKKQPKNTTVLTNLGMAQLKLNDLKSAKENFLIALEMVGKNHTYELNPEMSVIYNNIGSINVLEKNWGPAILNFENAVKHNSDYSEARLNLAKAFELAGRPEDAAEEYENYLSEPNVNSAFKPMVKSRLDKLKKFLVYVGEENAPTKE